MIRHFLFVFELDAEDIESVSSDHLDYFLSFDDGRIVFWKQLQVIAVHRKFGCLPEREEKKNGKYTAGADRV